MKTNGAPGDANADAVTGGGDVDTGVGDIETRVGDIEILGGATGGVSIVFSGVAAASMIIGVGVLSGVGFTIEVTTALVNIIGE